jgi:hypothetical protein
MLSNALFAQSVDEPFSKKKMHKDFNIFKNIRLTANSGLYKYRSKQEIDSVYNWADKQIDNSSTYREFYNIICQLTDFEGSLHNDTGLPEKLNQSLKNEKSGYFPYPIKWIEGKWILNYNEGKIPLGSEIISINNEKIDDIVKNLYKYYTTDGVNTTGKTIGINRGFSRYYRLNYGSSDSFKVTFKEHNSNQTQFAILKSVSYKTYYKNFDSSYSKLYDTLDYENSEEIEEKYNYRKINDQTGILTINTFLIGWNADDPKHKAYIHFLDSVFSQIKFNKINNLIVDVRHNGGGTDPNDLVTYSYLTNRNFFENKKAWIGFNKIPYLRYLENSFPAFLRPLFAIKYNKELRKEFPLEIDGKFYEDKYNEDHKIRTPNKNAFEGKIYLLISPRVASAGSLFAAMVTGNENSVVIGEEAMGGYYGHNGHTPITYILPKSKIKTEFSIVNLEQDVPKKENQKHNQGIIPDYYVIQTYEDYLKQTDTQMNFLLDLINKNMME